MSNQMKWTCDGCSAVMHTDGLRMPSDWFRVEIEATISNADSIETTSGPFAGEFCSRECAAAYIVKKARLLVSADGRFYQRIEPKPVPS